MKEPIATFVERANQALRLAEKATSAPWVASGVVQTTDKGRVASVAANFPKVGEAALCLIPMGRTDAEYRGAVADKNFIAAARTLVPALVADVRILAARLEIAEAALASQAHS